MLSGGNENLDTGKNGEHTKIKLTLIMLKIVVAIIFIHFILKITGITFLIKGCDNKDSIRKCEMSYISDCKRVYTYEKRYLSEKNVKELLALKDSKKKIIYTNDSQTRSAKPLGSLPSYDMCVSKPEYMCIFLLGCLTLSIFILNIMFCGLNYNSFIESSFIFFSICIFFIYFPHFTLHAIDSNEYKDIIFKTPDSQYYEYITKIKTEIP